MRLMTAIALAAVFAALNQSLAIGASQQWVMDYVATNTAPKAQAVYSQTVTNGNASVTVTNGADWVEMRAELYDRLALVATNVSVSATTCGVTNRMRFAWRGDGYFVNVPANLSIAATRTNFVFNGACSTTNAGVDRIEGYMDLVGTKITRSESSRLLGGAQ